MDMVTSIGAIAFRLKGAVTATLPWLELSPLPLAGGEPISVSRDEAASYLVVDHRRDPESDTAVRVEYWEATSPGEGELAGLFALCDAGGDASVAVRAASLSELRLAMEAG